MFSLLAINYSPANNQLLQHRKGTKHCPQNAAPHDFF